MQKYIAVEPIQTCKCFRACADIFPWRRPSDAKPICCETTRPGYDELPALQEVTTVQLRSVTIEAMGGGIESLP